MYDHVLVPTDGSATVPETLDHAIPLAASNDATIHALYVIDTRITNAAADETREELRATLESEGEAAVTEVLDRAEAAGVDAVDTVRAGTPSKTILDYVEEADIDLVVIGTRGKSPREKVTSLGSVSERVVDNASVPVFVVRNAGVEK